MHESSLNPAVIQRVTERRGGLRVFSSINISRTAHIVVDLQNGFMAPGAVAEIPPARDIVPNVNRISTAVRAGGGIVVFVQNSFDAIAVAFKYVTNDVGRKRSLMLEKKMLRMRRI